MQYDFDHAPNRFATNSYKWDVAPNELPMWVADMDFATAPEIIAAIQKRLDQGAFGYNIVPESFKQSIVNWWQQQHAFTMQTDWILYCTGVVPAISSIVRKMTAVNDRIVVLSPVYNIFYNSIVNNQRVVLESQLVQTDGDYTIDFADLEQKLALPETTMLIFCNPHNPIGKIWDRATLQRVGELCLKHDVLILSDEIHCDLAHQGKHYTPMVAVSPAIAAQTIMCVAPTKAFNIAGLQVAAIVVPNAELRQQVDRGINTDEVAEPNTFAIQAAEAAFNHGQEWLAQLIAYLEANRQLLERTINEKLPAITVMPADATYLAWLDCSQITDNTTELCHFIRQQTGLYLSDGAIFGGDGKQFIRWNYACPRERLAEGLEKFIVAIKNYQKNH